MAQQGRTTLKGYLNNGDQPTGTQFGNLVDSFSLVGELNNEASIRAAADDALEDDINTLATTASGIVSTTVNGTQASSTTLNVTDGSSFVDTAYIAYENSSGDPEYRRISSGGGTNSLTLDTAHGGVTDGDTVSMITVSEFLAADAVPHGNGVMPTLPDVITWVSDYRYPASGFGAALGATGAENATALQAAIDALSAASGGTIVLDKRGIYNSNSISLKPNVRLEGAERLGTILKLANSVDDHLIKITDAASIGIRNLTLDGNESNQTNGVRDVIRITDGEDIRIEDFYILNGKDCGVRITGDASDGTRRVWITNGRIYNCGVNNTASLINAGLIINNDSASGPASEQIFVANVIADTCGYPYTQTGEEGACFQVNTGNNIYFTDCEALNAGKYGFKLQGQRIFVKNARIYNQKFVGFAAQGGEIFGSNISIDGNNNPLSTGLVAGASTVSGLVRLKVRGLDTYNHGQDGIDIRGSATLNVRYVEITGFDTWSNDRYGITVRGDVDYVQLLGKSHENGNIGVYFGSEDTSIRSATYQWTASGSGTAEYYLEASGGGDPGISQPWGIKQNNVLMDAGTAGSLGASEWDWADNDALGFSTVYVRLSDDTDPDSKSAGYVEAVTIADAVSLPSVQSFDNGGNGFFFNEVTVGKGGVGDVQAWGNTSANFAGTRSTWMASDGFGWGMRTTLRELTSVPVLADLSEGEIAIGDGTESVPHSDSDALYFKPDSSKIIVIASDGNNLATRMITS